MHDGWLSAHEDRGWSALPTDGRVRRAEPRAFERGRAADPRPGEVVTIALDSMLPMDGVLTPGVSVDPSRLVHRTDPRFITVPGGRMLSEQRTEGRERVLWDYDARTEAGVDARYRDREQAGAQCFRARRDTTGVCARAATGLPVPLDLRAKLPVPSTDDLFVASTNLHATDVLDLMNLHRTTERASAGRTPFRRGEP